MTIAKAAFVPESDDTTWDDAVAVAVDWVENCCREEKAAGCLVTHTVGGADYTPTLSAFVRRHGHHATPRSRGGASGAGPTLVYVPDERLLVFAASLAHRSSLCAVEGSFNLSGWAAALKASNLTSGSDEYDISEEVRDEFDRLKFYGNNGWGDQFGKQWARRILPELKHALAGQPEVGDFIVGWLAALGASENGLKNIRKILDRISA